MAKKRHPAFGAWLRAHLDARAWSAADLAARVGVRPDAVYRWTAGKRAPLDPLVARIAAALALDPAEAWAALARDGVTPVGGPARLPPARGPADPRARPDRPFARWLRGILDERRLTPGQVAKSLDVHPKSARAWASGASAPASVHVEGLAAALGVDIATVRDALNRDDKEDSAQH